LNYATIEGNNIYFFDLYGGADEISEETVIESCFTGYGLLRIKKENIL
jgi:hypothetical protein